MMPHSRTAASPPRWRGALLSVLLAGPALAAAPFELVRKEADGLVLESRAAEGTDLPELRVRAHAPGSPRALANAVWSQGPGHEESRFLQRRKVLSSRAGARVEHHFIEAPVLGRRECVVAFTRKDDAAGNVAIDFVKRGLDDGLAADVRRMLVLRGSWRFTADAAGGTWVELRSLSDPGGVPAFLAVGPQRDMVVAVVRDAILRSAAVAVAR